MKKFVQVTDENGAQECVLLQGKYMKDKSATLGLALLYATGNDGNLYVMDSEFVNAILRDVESLNNIIHNKKLNNPLKS